MTKLKLSSKFKLFLAISIALIVIGAAIGTIGHFVWGGFFNYGDEFTPYKSVVVRYSTSEYSKDSVTPTAEKALEGLGNYSVSYSDALNGGEIVYKFSVDTDTSKLWAAANKINTELNTLVGDDLADLNVAYVREGTIGAGGSRALIFASIATASAVGFAFLYYIFRYKLRAACTSLLASVHNLCLFVALVAATRLPVGVEFVTISALIVFLTMLLSGVFFDKERKNFKNEAYAKSERAEVIEISLRESHKTIARVITGVMVVAIVFGVFAALAAMSIASFLIVPLVILGALACYYGSLMFVPSVFVKVDALCEKVKLARKEKKAEGKKQPAATEKAQA